MTEKASKINDAIYDCLERCYAAELPIACMAAYLQQLRRDPTWTMAEIHDVEVRVRQILTLIVKQPPADRVSA